MKVWDAVLVYGAAVLTIVVLALFVVTFAGCGTRASAPHVDKPTADEVAAYYAGAPAEPFDPATADLTHYGPQLPPCR